jgi:hypothetical protein
VWELGWNEPKPHWSWYITNENLFKRLIHSVSTSECICCGTVLFWTDQYCYSLCFLGPEELTTQKTLVSSWPCNIIICAGDRFRSTMALATSIFWLIWNVLLWKLQFFILIFPKVFSSAWFGNSFWDLFILLGFLLDRHSDLLSTMLSVYVGCWFAMLLCCCILWGGIVWLKLMLPFSFSNFIFSLRYLYMLGTQHIRDTFFSFLLWYKIVKYVCVRPSLCSNY